MRKKGHIWEPATCSCENDRYAGSIIEDSVIMCNEIIETTKPILTKTVPTKCIPTNVNERKVICKTKKFYILPAFLLVTMA